MLLQPAPIRPSLPFSRYPSPLSPPLLPLRSSLLYIPSALSRRGRARSPLNRRREPDSTDEAAWDLLDDDDIDDYDAEEFGKRRPRGFVAEGIEFDTSLEENLMKEFQRSSRDLSVNSNFNKVMDKKDATTDKWETMKKKKGVKGKKPYDKGTANAPNKMAFSAPIKGIRVRLWNLPKKKNIHRDLKSAFEGFRGILDINPAVSGTKKTRDPVCKGFAFVDLATPEAATRFVETYSTRSISFGRVEKRIGCCIVNPSANTTNTNPNANPTVVKLQKGDMLEPQLHDGFMGISENNKPSDESPIIFVEEDEEEEDTSSSLEILENYDDEADEDNSDQEIKKLTSEERKKVGGLKRRRVRPRKANSSGLSLPLRLKGRERDVLTGIFSKYSPKSGPAPTTES